MESKKTMAAQTAAAIRKELKTVFPGVKFSVTSSTYSGGDSVAVHTAAVIDREKLKVVLGKYKMGSFISMDDCYDYDNRSEDLPQVKFIFV